MSKLLTLTLIALALGTAVASAQDRPERNEDLESLEALLNESVVTTASRSAERVSSAPSAMFTIAAEDMQTYGIRSVDEALAFLGVAMRLEKSRDYYSGLDVGARGLMLRDYGRRLLVLLDGHVMNSQASGEIPLHEGLGVPLDAIDHIEVMLGAGSVMYGANAMTAVVHVITKNPEREHGVHAVSELSLAAPSGVDGLARWPGNGDRLGVHYRLGLGLADDFRLLGQRGSLTFRAEWQQDSSQTYEVARVTGESLQYRSDETSWGGFGKHAMQSGAIVASLHIGNFTLRTQGAFYERSMPMVSVFNDPKADEVRGAVRLDLSHVKQLSQTLHLTSRVYADFMRQGDRSSWSSQYWCAPEQIDGCEFSRRNVSRWLGLEQQLRFEPEADGTLTSLLGYDVRVRDGSGRPADYRDAVTGQYPSALELPYFNEQSVLGALFIQQIWSPVHWLTLNLGARLDIDSLFGAHPSPRAALVVVPVESGSVHASYSEAFRGPTAWELYAADPTYVLAPEALGPEIVRTGELEWQQRVSFLSLALRGWIASYQDFISERPATEGEVMRGIASRELASTVTPDFVVTNDNVDAITAYGGTFTVHARPATGLSLAAAITLSHTSASGPRETLWPAAFGSVRAAYELEPSGPMVALAAAYAFARKPFNSYADSEATTGPSSVSDALDLRLTLTSPLRAIPGLRLRAGVGYRVTPDAPYSVTGPSETEPDTRVQFSHEQPQVHLLLGVGYDL
jgi:outer membrane receptor protein involved in Fe transport